jgi:hypothetical protein
VKVKRLADVVFLVLLIFGALPAMGCRGRTDSRSSGTDAGIQPEPTPQAQATQPDGGELVPVASQQAKTEPPGLSAEGRPSTPSAEAKTAADADFDEGLVQAGREKAKALGLRPIPVYANADGLLVICPGTTVTTKKGQFVLADDDMVYNVGSRPVDAGDVMLSRGECAKAKDGIQKLEGVLRVPVSGPEPKAEVRKPEGTMEAPSTNGGTKYKPATGTSIRISGVLVTGDGKPVEGEEVRVFEGDADSFKLKTKPFADDPKFSEIVNPTGKSDTRGKFSIEFERQFFGPARSLVVLSGFTPTQHRQTGKRVVITMDETTKDIELGEITTRAESQ